MKITKTIAIIPVLLTLCGSTGCATGLKRTPLTDLSYKEYKTVGIQVLLPEQPFDIYSKYMLRISDSEYFQKIMDTKATITVQMHPFWSGQPLTEPQYFLSFWIARMSPVSYGRFTLKQHMLNGDVDFSFAYSNICTTVQEAFLHDKNSNFDYLCFRKDCPLADGDIVVIGAKLLHYKDRNPNEKEDVEAIRRILDSIRPLKKK